MLKITYVEQKHIFLLGKSYTSFRYAYKIRILKYEIIKRHELS